MNLRRTISAFLTVAMLLSLLCTGVQAASTPEEALGEVNIFSGGYSMNYLAVNGKVQTQSYTYFNFKQADGQTIEIPAYCVTPDQYGVPQTVGKGESIRYLAEEAATDPKIVGLVANMYPHRSLGELGVENKYLAFYAGKIALWCYIIPQWDISKVTINPNLTDPAEKVRAQSVLNAAIQIYTEGTRWTTISQPRLTITPDQADAYPVTIDGEAYQQQIFTVYSDTWVDGRSIQVSFTTPGSVPAGTEIADLQNQPITQIPVAYDNGGYSGRFKVLYPAESVEGKSGSVQLSFAADVYRYVVFYALCQEVDQYGELQSYLCDTDPKTSLTGAAVSQYTADEPDDPDDPEDPPGDLTTSLRIIKLEEGTRQGLEGAVFSVTGPDGKPVGSFSTGTDGTVLIPLLQSGLYTVTEEIPPRYHLLAEEDTQQVTVVYGETAEVTFWNAPYGELRVEKIDSDTGDRLAGATIQIKHIESGATYTGITEAGGSYTFTKLRPGAYEITELTAPAGWQRDPQTYTTTVNSGETVSYTLKNQANPGLRIIKYDRKTYETLSGVTFEIFRDGTSLGKFQTDAMGEILLTDLQPGTYRAVEVDTGSDGHILDTTPQEVELRAGDGIRQLVFFNDEKPGLRLVKVDASDPSKVIPNAVFEIEAVDGSYGPEEFTTGQNGEIDLSGLPAGAYVVTEKLCSGYVIDQAQRIIQLDPNEDAQFVFTNSIKPSLRLVKTSADGTALAGVSFRIASIADGSHYLDRTTNAQGEILVAGLEPGVYSIRETATTADHILDAAEYHVELFPGRTSTITLQNDRRPSLTIRKTDKDTGDPVPGVTFTLNCADGPTITTEPTGEDGTVTIENLLPGVYTVTEQSVPEGYLLDPTPQQITLFPNRDAKIQFQNYQRPTLTIHKADIHGNPLTGAIFEVRTKAGVEIGDFPVGPDGSVTVDNIHLDEGYYIITEIQAPEGYLLDATPHEVCLRPGKTTEITIENEKKPGLTIQKIDSITGNRLKGAKFELWVAKDNTEDGTYQKLDQNYYYTDETGEIVLEQLDPGWYKVVEVEPPPGYALRDPSEQTIYVDNDKSVELIFENTPLSALVVWKYDSVTGEALEGAVFQVRYLGGTSGSGGTVIGTYRTSANGSFTVTGLEAGTYLVEELDSPDGHVIDTPPQTAYLSGREQDVVQLHFGNSPKGALLIKKVDASNGNPISDVEFMVTTADGAVVGDANGKFVTDSAGTILIEGIEPGTTLVVRETRARTGYELDDTPQTATVRAGQTVTLEFRNQPEGNLIIHKLDSVTRKPLEGVEFQITYADGSYVDAQGGTVSSKGLYRTDSNGQIILSGITGTIVVTETQTIPGYTIHQETRSQTVAVNPNDTQQLTFYNDPIGGVEILKVNAADTSQRIPNVTFEIRRMDDALVDTVTTGQNGRVFCSLEDGAYYALEVKAAEGFRLDSTPHYFEVRQGKTVTLTISNEAFSGIILHKIDSVTGEGISGVKFLLYDAGKNPLGEYTTDNEGYIYIDDAISTGKGRFYLRELEAAEGYVLDEDYKTVYVQPGKTIEIEWENTPVTGQIQVLKYAAQANTVTGDPAGTPLQGAVFEISEARSGRVVDYITTDARGVAASGPLPLTRYRVVEVTAPPYYQLDPTVHDVTLEYAGQIIKLSSYDKPAELKVSVTKTGNRQLLAGDSMRYDLTVANLSNVALENFYLHDQFPVDCAQATTVTTGTYNTRLNYQITYRTNYHDYRVLASNLLSTNNYAFDLTALSLMQGEVVTDVRLEFGRVPAGFANVGKPTVTIRTNPSLANGCQVVNRADAGGQYLSQWETGRAAWITIILRLNPPTLPKTGY